MRIFVCAEIGPISRPEGGEMDPITEQHGEWTSDLAGAEDLLDQPDGDESMEHSGLKIEAKRPPVQPVGADNATGAVKIADTPHDSNHVTSPTLGPSQTNFVGGNGADKTAVPHPPAMCNNSSNSGFGRTNGVGGKYLPAKIMALLGMSMTHGSG